MAFRVMMFLIVLTSANTTFAAGASCDRACLRTMLDRYLDAVVKHDPSAAPLAPGFRQTENAIVTIPGTGVWKTVTALGGVQRRYMDPSSSQVGYFGIVEETGGPTIVTIRLRIDDRKVTEAEWIIARKGDFGPNGPGGNLFNPEALAMTPPPERTIARDARLPREAMTAIANSYFDGLTTHDGNVIQHHPGCSRIENGTTVTGRGRRGGGPQETPQSGGGAGTGAGPSEVSDCSSGLATINIALVAARRYPIVDEEAGVVLGMGVFIRKPGTPNRRNLLTEWFFIEGNRIRTIYAAMHYPPPDVPVPNWPPYEGNWPLPAGVVPPPATQQ